MQVGGGAQHGVVHPTRDPHMAVGHVGEATARSVHNVVEPQARIVHFTGAGCPGFWDRCGVSSVVWDVGVHIPSDSNSQRHTDKAGYRGAVHHDSHCSLLEERELVHVAVRASDRLAGGDSELAYSATAAQVIDLPSKPQHVQSTHVKITVAVEVISGT